MQFDFTQKNVLITGGSRGIGRACAQLFTQSGANVLITYRSNKEEAERTLALLKGGGTHAAYPLNVADAADVEQCSRRIIANHTQIDVLVNNAGVFIEHKIAEVDFEQWQQAWHETIQTNLVGAGHLCYFIARNMMEHGGGKIVNVSSRGAFRGEPDHPAYGASKAGLNAMSQSLAVALAPHNIAVGVVAPGFVETDMTTAHLEGAAGAAIRRQSPFNRVATPEEVARVIAVFASGGLEFMSGGIVDLNGASYLRS